MVYMGFLDYLGYGRARSIPTSVPIFDNPNDLEIVNVVLSDILGSDQTDSLPLSRGEALTIPAVAAASNLLNSAIASLPLTAFKGSEPLENQPTWLYKTSLHQSPYLRLGRTVQDLLFTGYSLWQVGSRGFDGFPISAAHVPQSRWSWDAQGRISIDDHIVQDTEVILFESLYPGLLNVAGRTLRAARDIERVTRARSKFSMPLLAIQDSEDSQLEEVEVQDFLRQYNGARSSLSAPTTYVPKGLSLQILEGQSTEDNFLLAARNAVISDVAKHTGIPSALLEGTSGIDSLTYTTEKGQRSRFQDFNLRLWLDPISARLTQDDCVPAGTRIAIDTSELTDTSSPTDGPQNGPAPVVAPAPEVAPTTAPGEAV